MSHEPGEVLKNTYRLESVLGKGGMGEVFAAVHLVSGESVAIKVVHREQFDETLRQRLRREATAAARLKSEFAPRLLEVLETDEGEIFLVMERLYGETLSRRLRARTALDWGAVQVFGEDLLRGLIDAHTAGVVHRDLKPGNVFMARWDGQRERAMILDFGICKLDAHDGEHLTETGEALGTIAYMAPEQIRGAARVDERADLYAVGMVIFEMLTGRLAYDAQGQVALIAAKLESAARRVSELAAVPVPVGLEALLARALARKPQERFASAQEMLKAWRALGPPSVLPRPQPSSPHGSTTLGAMTAGTLTRQGGAGGGRMWLLIAAASLGIGVLGIVGVVVGSRNARAPVVEMAAPPEAPPTDPTSAPSSVVLPDNAAILEIGQTPTASARPVARTRVAQPPPRGSAKPRPKSGSSITEEPRY